MEINLKSASEKSKLKPFNSYTKSKVKLEKMIKITNLNYKIIRLSNVYDDKLDKKDSLKILRIAYKIKHIIFLLTI